MTELHQKKTKLEGLVNDFQSNNEEYIKITKDVKDKVLGVLSNAKALLRYALLSMTQSIRNNPETYRSLFYNVPSIIECYNTASYMYGGQIQQSQQYPSSNYNTEANVAIMVDETEKLYSKVVKDCINKFMIIDYTLSKSPLPLLLPPNEE